jgi:protein transport protein SEC61 subunit alpha
MPLFGIVSSNSSDPLYWLQIMTASNHGTLMELGIAPIITSSKVLQLLASAHILDIDMNLKNDRRLYQTAQKLLALLLSFGQACIYVVSEIYGPRSEFDLGTCIFLVSQLVAAGLIVM